MLGEGLRIGLGDIRETRHAADMHSRIDASHVHDQHAIAASGILRRERKARGALGVAGVMKYRELGAAERNKEWSNMGTASSPCRIVLAEDNPADVGLVRQALRETKRSVSDG